MICTACCMVQHHECQNLVDNFGHPRPRDVGANWCDCQHRGNEKTTSDDTTLQNRDAWITMAESV